LVIKQQHAVVRLIWVSWILRTSFDRAKSPRTSFDRNATKEALLSTAERLYAERGLDAVSMREITREAGQRQRFLIAMSQWLHGLAEIDRLQERRSRSPQRFDVERAIENLIDMTAGALSAPVSIEVIRRIES
jgi:hypothetical protein